MCEWEVACKICGESMEKGQDFKWIGEGAFKGAAHTACIGKTVLQLLEWEKVSE